MADKHTITQHTNHHTPASSLLLLLLLLALLPFACFSPVQQLPACDQLCHDVHLAASDVHGVQLDAVGVVHLQQQQLNVILLLAVSSILSAQLHKRHCKWDGCTAPLHTAYQFCGPLSVQLPPAL